MLTILANMMGEATRQNKWDAPQNWRGPNKIPMSDREARQIEEERKKMQFRHLW